MTPQKLANTLRWKANVSTSAPFDDTNLLQVVNTAKDDISQAIVQVNPDYFEEDSVTDSVSGQGEYTKPSDLLLMKRVEVSYSDTNTGSFTPARIVTLQDISDYGIDWYQMNQSTGQPMVRFADTGFFIYPTPASTSFGTGFIKLWYVPKRSDLTSLSDSTNDIETITGIGFIFHSLIQDLVVNEIKFKKGELTQLDVQDSKQNILDILVPAAFRTLSTTQSTLPNDSRLQY